MWIINKTAKLNLSKVRSSFKKVSGNDFTLIFPKKNVWDWNDDERFLRSIVVDKNGYVVSCGWPKFGNYGEFFNDTKLLEDTLKNNQPVKFTNKEDGTLCIRSIFDNQVVLRTRGTLYGELPKGNSFKDRFFNVAKKYPMILNFDWMNDCSLLFEYVSPNNKIVVNYKEDDLIFIGCVFHNLQLSTWDELEKIANEGKLNLVKVHNLPKNPSTILNEIKDWKEEGIVVRYNGGQNLIKFKSAYYLAQHRIKYSVNYKFLVEFVELSGIKSEQELINELKKCNYDYEIIEIIIPFYKRYEKVIEFINDSMKEAENLLSSFSTNKIREVDKRKELAIYIKDKKKHIKTFVFNLYDGNFNKINNLKRKIIMNEGAV